MKVFDAALKHAVSAHPADWAHFLGVPPGIPVEAVDAEVSVVTQAADKLLRIASDPPALIHVEFHGWSDPEFDERMLMYQCTIRRRESLPVHSVAFILVSKAWRADNRGGVSFQSMFPGCRLEFNYQVIKIWELPVESILAAGLGVLPLAPLANVNEAQLPEVVEAMSERLRHTERSEAAELWAATHLLMGLKYERELVSVMLQKVRSVMEYSTTYQEIIEKGEAKGSLRRAREVILRLGSRRFQPPSESIRQSIQSIQDDTVLDQLLDRVLVSNSWEELLEGLELEPASAARP